MSAATLLPEPSATADALPDLSPEEILRYSRHLIIPDVGITGQKKLKAARVLLIGAGDMAELAARHAAKAPSLRPVDYSLLLNVVFTHPQVATIAGLAMPRSRRRSITLKVSDFSEPTGVSA